MKVPACTSYLACTSSSLHNEQPHTTTCKLRKLQSKSSFDRKHLEHVAPPRPKDCCMKKQNTTPYFPLEQSRTPIHMKKHSRFQQGVQLQHSTPWQLLPLHNNNSMSEKADTKLPLQHGASQYPAA
ncbi:hypothetical protein Nepgr_021037 [Nepenthes gracilis]|uniref:Uncharacterized protein n=1 Tax=Nepenthes gracilis TaxID=150966 RepID=A0AAD3SYD9_NEPGR|nr:hypothetical protein Nepgr_021037 [Nepenthes gracilis]